MRTVRFSSRRKDVGEMHDLPINSEFSGLFHPGRISCLRLAVPRVTCLAPASAAWALVCCGFEKPSRPSFLTVTKTLSRRTVENFAGSARSHRGRDPSICGRSIHEVIEQPWQGVRRKRLWQDGLSEPIVEFVGYDAYDQYAVFVSGGKKKKWRLLLDLGQARV